MMWVDTAPRTLSGGVVVATLEPIGGDEAARRRATCDACKLVAEASITFELVYRHQDDEEPARRDADNVNWRAFDALSGGPERRAHRRKVEAALDLADGRLMRKLAAGGCPHALYARG